MLDDYTNTSSVAIDIMKKAIYENKISHAYLFETDGSKESFNIIMSFVKAIVCSNHYTNNSKCDTCNICSRIDNNNYMEVKIIEPDGNWIKKEQLVSLQDDFNMKALEGNMRVYVIKNCDRMNKQAANSILKFLEEPVSGIVAILITDNVNKLLDTIVSRCQLIKINVNNVNADTTIDNLNKLLIANNYSGLFKKEEDKRVFIDNVIKFILYLENNKVATIVNVKKLWHNNFDNREISSLVMDMLINFYFDVLLNLNNRDSVFFVDRQEDINSVVRLNTTEKVNNKIKILIDSKDDLKFNLNLNLFVSKLIIDLGGD